MNSLIEASFAVLDAAKMNSIFKQAASRNSRHLSLYKGESEYNLASVAPYLFSFTPASEFAKWLFSIGWGESWGVYIVAPVQQQELHQHLRKFLLVKTEKGQEMYFRYYDPRVLRVVLPSFAPAQLKEFFGPIQEFIVEDENPTFALKFRLEGSRLLTHREFVSAVRLGS